MSGPLATKSYQPAGTTSVPTSSATFADIDATNLKVSFTVPASGQVLVVLSSELSVPNGSALSWNLRDSNGDIANTAMEMLKPSLQTVQPRLTYRQLITGLTPGQNLTWKWGQALTTGASASNTIYGGVNGQALMEVWSA